MHSSGEAPNEPKPCAQTSATTPFQFSIESEEGICLVVDLNSSISTWLDGFKNEISLQHSMRTLLHGGSSYIATGVASELNRSKRPSRRDVTDTHSKLVESVGCCTSSSVSSAISENCQSKLNLPNVAAPSENSPVNLLANPVGFWEPQTGVDVAASSCHPSDTEKQTEANIASCPSAAKMVFSQDSLNVSRRITRSSAALHLSAGRAGSSDAKCNTELKKRSGKSAVSNEMVNACDYDSCAVLCLGSVKKISSEESFYLTDVRNSASSCPLTAKCVVDEVSSEHELLDATAVSAAEGAAPGQSIVTACLLDGQKVAEFPVNDTLSGFCSSENSLVDNSNTNNANTAVPSVAMDIAMYWRDRDEPGSGRCCGSPNKKRSPESESESPSTKKHVYIEVNNGTAMASSSKEAQQGVSVTLRRSQRIKIKAK